MNIKRNIGTAIYYLIAIRFPKKNAFIGGKLGKEFRGLCTK